MPYEIKSITCLREVNEIVRLHNRVWNNSPGIIDLLENATECFILVNTDIPKVVGYLFVEEDTEKGFWELNDLAVDPDDRGHGGGRLLMEKAKHSYPFLKLNASIDNTSLIEFYKRLGFETEAIMENYYAINADAVRMVWKK